MRVARRGTDPALEALPGERRDLGGVVQHDGDDGRVLVTQHLTPDGLQALAEEVAVLTNRRQLLLACSHITGTQLVRVVLRVICNEVEEG